MKIFISYNHQDQEIALKIRDVLAENGFEVMIDRDKMRTGQDIEQFIIHCIQQSGVTLSLVSTNSLMSAWVAMETVMSTAEEKMSRRFFVPCYIDHKFLDRNFTGLVLEKIDGELNEISTLMRSALEKEWGIEDLQSERTRYIKMKAHLPEIIGKLRGSLCIDLTPENFDLGMQKIIDDLRKQAATDESVSVKSQTTGVIEELKSRIAGTLDELARQRLQAVSRRLSTLQDLMDRYEQELDLETDPKRQMRYEREIENTRKNIRNILDEIKSL